MDFRNYTILMLLLCLLVSLCMNFVLLGKRITEGDLENEDADDESDWEVDYPEEDEETVPSERPESRGKEAA